MSYSEVSERLNEIKNANRPAFLAQYAGHELGTTESAPFVKAALERCPVSREALRAKDVLGEISRMPSQSIYDGKSRLATPDEAWNFGVADGLEKCFLAANALPITKGTVEIEDSTARLVDDKGKIVCAYPTAKVPLEKRIKLD